jgi:hypothetical protein
MAKKNSPGCGCCGCIIGFENSIIDFIVDAFPNGTGNGLVTGSTINTSSFGPNLDKPLDVFYWGMFFGSPPCYPPWGSVPTFTTEINTFLTNGGKVLIALENSILCLSDDFVDEANQFLSDIGSGMSITKDTTLDGGCQEGVNVASHYFTTASAAGLKQIDSIGLGGASEILLGASGEAIMYSNDDDTKVVLAVEPISSGWIMLSSDANMFDSCDGLGQITDLMGNFCKG